MVEIEQQWLLEFQVEDLSRALIREYFVQNRLTQTLSIFEQEDIKNARKINKSVLIKMLSMTALFQQNKSFEKPHRSLIEILCSYLRNKFKQKMQRVTSQQSQLDKLSKADSLPKEELTQNHEHVDQIVNPPSISASNNFQQKQSMFLTKAKIQIETSTSNIKQSSSNQKPDQFSTTQDSKQKKEFQRHQNKQSAQHKRKTQRKTQTLNIESNGKGVQVDERKAGSRVTGMRKMGRKDTQACLSAKPQQVLQSQTQLVRASKQPTTQLTQVIKQEKSHRVQSDLAKENLQVPQKNHDATQKNVRQQNKEQAKKMVKMFGKKGKISNQKQGGQPQKFQFDENFVDQPLHVREEYNYQKLDLTKFTIKTTYKAQISYKEKKPAAHNNGISKKKNEKPLSQGQIKNLKRVIFQNGNSILPKSWHQGFILSPFAQTPYGLKQVQGGPCGIIAALQCYYLKHLISLSKPINEEDLSNETRRQISLVAAITDMLLKVKSSDKLYLTLPPKNFTGSKLDFSTLGLSIIDADCFEVAFEGVWNHRSSFIGQNNHGVTILMYCIVMTKGPQTISKEIDCPENPLIGHHGHCTQQLVNLFITGKAVSNCFDGDKIIDDNYKIKGINEKAQFGFLTIFQTLKYIEVGKNLKKPIYPIWIICKEFHYHVIFGNHYLVSENDDAEKFDIVYFDGLYNCADRILLTFEKFPYGEQPQTKPKQLPLIEQVTFTKWGPRKVDWNGSIKIL